MVKGAAAANMSHNNTSGCEEWRKQLTPISQYERELGVLANRCLRETSIDSSAPSPSAYLSHSMFMHANLCMHPSIRPLSKWPVLSRVSTQTHFTDSNFIVPWGSKGHPGNCRNPPNAVEQDKIPKKRKILVLQFVWLWGILLARRGRFHWRQQVMSVHLSYNGFL